MSISRDQFLAYERVRRLGVVNMFDLRKVAQLSGLRTDEALEITKDYERLRREYLLELAKEGK